MIIAIDGPAASGKGTLARRIAEHFGYHCLDTGLLYRAVARDTVRAGASLEDETAAVRAAKALDAGSLGDPALRQPGAGDAASIVAKFKGVRDALLEFQRAFARREPGAVLDGRDIGTVVCPDADVKIFVTASAEVRAHRRTAEQQAKGERVDYERVLDIIRRRDARDAGRTDAPMRAADDAERLDTSELDIDAAFAEALRIVERQRGRRRSA